jgi:hypothetical protein
MVAAHNSLLQKGLAVEKTPPSNFHLIAATMAMVVPIAISDSHTA